LSQANGGSAKRVHTVVAKSNSEGTVSFTYSAYIFWHSIYLLVAPYAVPEESIVKSARPVTIILNFGMQGDKPVK